MTWWMWSVVAVAGLLTYVAWRRHPHHRHSGGMRLRDSPFSSRAAVYMAYDDETPETHEPEKYDGD